MISEEAFAQEEARLGKQVHLHDGVWWVKTAPFYYKPIHEFRPFPPKSARPHPLKALVGYSHQVPDRALASRHVVWNVLDGDNLTNFSMDMLKPAKRRAIRKGQRDCIVDVYLPTNENLEQMRLTNISLAGRCEGVREPGSFLPADYYIAHAGAWREDILKLFSHQGHQFFGAFFDNILVAYINLIIIEDTWIFSGIKSITEYLPHRPVDALYFSILSRASLASKKGNCSRVLNGGGGINELESLARFKADYLLIPKPIPYYSRTVLPIDTLRRIRRLFRFGGRHHQPAQPVDVSAKPADADSD